MTIPASDIVSVTPSVLAAGGSALDLSGLILTRNTRVPIGTVQSFVSAAAVASFFGGGSSEATKASVYFSGFDGSNVKPGALLFTQYPLTAVAAYIRGGNISAMTLAALQAINGSLTITVDGFLFAAGAVNLSAATSFSSAATIIQSALNAAVPAGASFTGVISGTTLTASAVTGSLAVGHKLGGAGITAGTYIAAQLTGSPGAAGTYRINTSQTVGSEAMTSAPGALAVTYDSVSGAFVITSGILGATSTVVFATGTIAATLLLTSATGAVLSQGADAAVPSTFMTATAKATQNWATFMTAFDPDSGSGNTQKLAFALWTSQQNQRYAYVCFDLDASPTVAAPAAGSLGQLIAAAGYSGTFLIWEPSDLNHAAFVLGVGASIDFTQANGRTTYKFRSQAGLTPGVTDEQVAANLAANGYNFYGAYATAKPNFQFLANGVVSGAFDWMDSYVNQIWLNNNLQLALTVLMTQSKSIPYNSAGYGLLASALQEPINEGLNFGAFRAGVQLSAAQIAAVNAAAGQDIATTLANVGYYLLILSAAPSVRAARGSPPMTFFYVDGQSVQQINLASIDVQ